MNRHTRPRYIQIVGATGLSALCSGVALVWLFRAAVASTFIKFERHTATLAVFAAVVSAVVVSRQRSLRAARAERSWVAALPVSHTARRVEKLVLPLVPVLAAMTLASCIGLLTCAELYLARLPARPGITALCWLLGGALAGAAAGLAVPSPKPEILHPGSRYVPHRATASRHPTPSLRALGIWPIRRLFALLQPKMVSRTLLPVLLAVPLGTSAAAAMLWIGEFGLFAALVLLGQSVAWVWHAARDWLRPLPVAPQRLLGVIAWRALIATAALGVTAVWLGWVGRP